MALMTLGMAGTASVDAVIKSVSTSVTPSQVVIVVGFGGAVVFGLAAAWQGLPLLSRSFFHPAVVMRNFFEVVGSFGTVMALALVPVAGPSTAPPVSQLT